LLFVGAAGAIVGYQATLANAHRILRWHHRRRRLKRLEAERALPPAKRSRA
jgi:hypothetical protein